MWYLLEVMLEHLQILYVALCNGDKDLRKRYVARLYRMVSVRCLTVAWRQKAGACLRGQWKPGNLGRVQIPSRTNQECQPLAKH